MLRTEQILNAKFTPVSKGTYSAEEVDAFLKVVAESYETLSGEKSDLIKKISILADKIESYRNDEEAIKLALLDAHKMAETISKNATIKSDTLIGDAETRAQLIVDGANRQSAKEIDDARAKAKEIVDNARVAVASLTQRAQNDADATVSAANEKAAKIVADAKANADEIVGASKKSYEFYTAELARVQAAAADFKASMTALCNNQLDILSNVPAVEFAAAEIPEEIITDVPATPIEEIAEEIVADVEFAEDAVFDIEEELAVVEEETESATEEVPVIDESEVEEEQIVFVPEEPIAEIIPEEEVFAVEIPEEVEEETVEDVKIEVEDDDDHLFGFIDELIFDDFSTPDSIPSSLDDLLPSTPAAEESIVDAIDDEDDDFEGFKIDLDSIGMDDDNSDEDITSLFDSIFED